MSRRKIFKETERRLDKKYEKININEIVLKEDSFKDGRLTKVGYLSLKKQSDYISINDQIDLFIPRDYENKFKHSLEYIAAKELANIKKDLRRMNLVSLILLIIGAILLILPNVLDILKFSVFDDVIIIIGWVFVWSAVEKKFFDRHGLKKDKMKILHILSANIITY